VKPRLCFRLQARRCEESCCRQSCNEKQIACLHDLAHSFLKSRQLCITIEVAEWDDRLVYMSLIAE
jgi:5-carboxymethyl-2-hydroxymuconate isomerase